MYQDFRRVAFPLRYSNRAVTKLSTIETELIYKSSVAGIL